MRDELKIKNMREGGKVIVEILRRIVGEVRPGITTLFLDQTAESLCEKWKVKPAFKGYSDYPATLCIGPEDIVVHGIPDGRVLREGEIVSLDFGIIYQGYYLDMARTVPVGSIRPEIQDFLDTTALALKNACEVATVGHTIGDIGYAICTTVEAKGYSVVREMVGHTIGRHLHEDPMIPGYGNPGEGEPLYDGQTIAIEAIINQGRPGITISKQDGWTSRTKDGKLSALFENTVLVSDESEILTPL